MAKTTKERSKKTRPAPRDGAAADKALRTLDETFEERRFEPTARGSAYVGAVLLSFGGLLLGAGTYAFGWVASGPWHENAHLFVVAGLVFELGFLFMNGQPSAPVRIGALGLGLDEDGKVRRIAWCDVEQVSLAGRELSLKTSEGEFTLRLDVHRSAAAFLVAEARTRIPQRVAVDEAQRAELGPADGGVRVLAEAPQVAGERCRASGKALTFEKDVRMCGRCGALYHREGVPRACLGCDAKLKAS
ncbi:MAG: hypothetical protein FJ095_02210 [Deltaproteobacteria bacterium]|nr:hypothetical protein [Deltaproteobacteria bacterium]